MYCMKCGAAVAEGTSFCTACGAKIVVTGAVPPVTSPAGQPVSPASATPVQPVEPVQPVTPIEPVTPVKSSAPQDNVDLHLEDEGPIDLTKSQSQNSTYQSGQTTGSGTYQSGQTGQSIPSYQSAIPTPPVKKKSKAPVIIGVLVAIIAVLGVAVFFLMPNIQMLLHPEEKAKEALHASIESAQAKTVSAFASENLTNTDIGNMDFEYSLKLDRASVANMNLCDKLKVDTFKIRMQVFPEDKVIAGSVGVASGDAPSVVEIQYYMDKNNFYMSIPALFKESLMIKTSTILDNSDISYDQLFGYMTSNSNNLSAYSGVVQALVNDVFNAADSLVQEVTYEKLGKTVLNGQNGEVKATQFMVTISEENIKSFAKNCINNIYNDDSLKTVFALLTVGSGVDLNAINNVIGATDLGFSSIVFDMFINGRGELVKLTFNTDNIVGTSFDTQMEASVEFLGKKSIYDEVKYLFSVKDDDVNFSLNAAVTEDAVQINCRVEPVDSGSAGEYVEISVDMTADQAAKTVQIRNMSFKGMIERQEIDFAMSGEMRVQEAQALMLKASDFGNAINCERMTSAQSSMLSSELMQNISVLKNILSDELYNDLMKTIFGLSFSF